MNVTVSNGLTLDPIIFVGGAFARFVTVTLPVLPEGAGTVVVTPVFTGVGWTILQGLGTWYTRGLIDRADRARMGGAAAIGLVDLE